MLLFLMIAVVLRKIQTCHFEERILTDNLHGSKISLKADRLTQKKRLGISS